MLDLCYCGSGVEHHLGKTKTALFNHSNSPQKSIKKQHLLVWLSGRAPPW